MRYSQVIWDFNGTILDDLDAMLCAVNDMLGKRGLKPIGLERYYELVDTPIIRFYERLFDLNAVPFETIQSEFAEGYARHGGLICLGGGVSDALERFREGGVRQVIISSFLQADIEQALAQHGIAHYFEDVLGAFDRRAESKIERAQGWLRSAQPGEGVVIGDTLHDYEMACALGMDCVLIECGHQGPQVLRGCGARVVPSVRELFDALS